MVVSLIKSGLLTSISAILVISVVPMRKGTICIFFKVLPLVVALWPQIS